MKKAVVNYLVLSLLLILNLSFTSWAKSGNKGVTQKKSCYVYISVNQEKKIVIFKLKSGQGRTSAAGENWKLAGLPGSLCTDPANNMMYAALRDIKSVAAIKIDRKNGPADSHERHASGR